MSIEHFSGFAHASSGAENEWSEGCQLNFVDPLLIQAPFDLFMMGITGRDEKPLVGWCVWVKYLAIKKCTLVRGSPESLLEPRACHSYSCRCTTAVLHEYQSYGYGRVIYVTTIKYRSTTATAIGQKQLRKLYIAAI